MTKSNLNRKLKIKKKTRGTGNPLLEKCIKAGVEHSFKIKTVHIQKLQKFDKAPIAI